MKHKFTGQELDDETGLYYYGARFYDPAIGRFISADSIVPDFSNPQSLNRYSYVFNNPLSYRDPNGHNPFLIVMAISAVISSVVAGIQSNWNEKAMTGGFIVGGISIGNRIWSGCWSCTDNPKCGNR